MGFGTKPTAEPSLDSCALLRENRKLYSSNQVIFFSVKFLKILKKLYTKSFLSGVRGKAPRSRKTGKVACGPSDLKIKAACVGIDVNDLAREIKTGDKL